MQQNDRLRNAKHDLRMPRSKAGQAWVNDFEKEHGYNSRATLIEGRELVDRITAIEDESFAMGMKVADAMPVDECGMDGVAGYCTMPEGHIGEHAFLRPYEMDR